MGRVRKNLKRRVRKNVGRVKKALTTGHWLRSQKVCLGLVYTDNLHRRTWASVLNLAHNTHHRIRLLHQIGSLVHKGRNNVVRRFLETGYDWLLFIDADMFFPDGINMPKQMNLLDSLLRWGQPIVSALCVKRLPPHNPVISKWTDRKDWTKAAKTILSGYHNEHSELIRVDAVGAALMLIHKDVFKKINEAGEVYMMRPNNTEAKWKEQPFDMLGPFGEDYSFCWRAMEQGFAINVDTGIPTCHIGDKLYSLMDYEAFKDHKGVKLTEIEASKHDIQGGGAEMDENY